MAIHLTPDELDAMLTEGLASRELTETEFWGSADQETNALLAGCQANRLTQSDLTL
jgi:hypothetical protein